MLAMKAEDLLKFSLRASSGYLTRTVLILLAMAIGAASVMLLTALGEGARLYVNREFTSLGTNLLIVLPGRSETTGGPPPLLGQTPRDLTLSDAQSLLRSMAIHRVAPISVGAASVSWQRREREVTILGSTPDIFEIRDLAMIRGRFLPTVDPTLAASVCVLGYRLKNEIFGNTTAMGQRIRIGDRRFRVIGILAPKGQSIGLDMSDVAIVPVASAQELFNTSSLFRIMVQAKGRETLFKAKESILSIIRSRHDGEDDITVITQDALLATFDRIINALTLTVAGIAGISLAVAGILIMNVMLISVSQRTAEVGLLKAIGASAGQVLTIFLTEAALLSLMGALAGMVFALIGNRLLASAFPSFPMRIPLWAAWAAIGVSLLTGLIFGVLPARRAARLDAVLALARR
jgi:putative ABC transport system permease protein